MRVVLGWGSHMWIWEAGVKHATIRSSHEEDVIEDEDHVSVDPHGTVSAHMELSPQAIFEGASARRFGFHVSEEASS